ncbi:Fc.00g084640.m01.CDS01 [Cosmosporella sp. VM-42]
MGLGRWLVAGAAVFAAAEYIQSKSEGQRSSGSGSGGGSTAAFSSDSRKKKALEPLYKSLRLVGSNDIRLITLKPGDYNDPIVLSMEVANSQIEEYEALSYTWGSSVLTQRVEISGCSGWITESLDLALRHLRAPAGGNELTLWVDALCIDQCSDLEKNKYIPIMGQIYNRAQTVLVWLGEDDYKSRSAMNYFNNLRYDPRLPLMTALEESFGGDMDEWYNFGDSLLTREWWGRAWVVQEYIMSRKMLFICGHDSMSEDLFTTIVMFAVYRRLSLFRTSPGNAIQSHTRQAAQALFAAKDGKKTGALKNDLCAWITNFHPWGCRDEVDRIYAFMGMVDNCTIIPRYELKLQWPKVYAEAAVEIMRQRNSLDFICVGQGKARHKDLPANWVPDLRMHPVETPALLPLNYASKSRYKASNESGFEAEVIGNELKVNGIRFAQIKETTILHDEEEKGIPETKTLAYGQGGRHRTTPYTHKSEHTCEVAMVRTLCWDLNHERQRCGPGETFAEREPHWPVPRDFRPEVVDEYHRRNLFEVLMSVAASQHRNLRRFAILDGGYFAMVPPDAQLQDWVCVLEGASVPMVLRKVQGTALGYKFIGECYVHGIMDGELWRRHIGPLDNFYLG